MKSKTAFCLLLSVCCFLLVGCSQPLNSGDLIFVSSENSDFEKSIVEVTKSENELLNFSHVGILNVTDSGIFVIEAVPEKGVVYTSIKEFEEANNNSILYIGIIKSKYKKYAKNALNRACSHLGKDYDYAFDFENDLYYCSELVYDAYAHASGDSHFFETPNMTFKKEGTDEILPFWVEYFEKLGVAVPEGKSGINPTGLSRSKKLKIKKIQKKEIPRFARNDKSSFVIIGEIGGSFAVANFAPYILSSAVIPNEAQRSEESRH